MIKIVGLEEHLVTPQILDAWAVGPGSREGSDGAFAAPPALREQLTDLGSRRLNDMDEQGIDVQVLSVTSPGVQNLDPATAVALARHANDHIAAAVRATPERFQGFATLPTSDPPSAGEELRRAVTELGLRGAMIHGRTGAINLDHADFAPIWAAASDLRCPLHPQHPVAPVRDAYYTGFDPFADAILAGPMIGWHYETGVQLLRLVLAGTFDRFPDLQVIAGHWGEVVLFYLDRIAEMQDVGKFKLARPSADYFRRNISYTGSGQLSDRYLRWTIEMVGIDRILYATDYPFIDNGAGKARRFLEHTDVSDDDRKKIAHGNWEQLTAHIA